MRRSPMPMLEGLTERQLRASRRAGEKFTPYCLASVRVNAAPVVVGTGARPGRVTVHLGITSDGLATDSTQLAGRGGCTQRK
jgi:hypothetical protein